MTAYRRPKVPSATWFFTVNCAQRHGNRVLTDNIDSLRAVFRKVRATHPFAVPAIVVLPEQPALHLDPAPERCGLSNPLGTHQGGLLPNHPPGERRCLSRVKRGERGICQRRYWEHLIRDETDLARHVDYIHFNPVKHGWVQQVADWPWSSFHRYLAQGIYPPDWAEGPDPSMQAGE